MRVFSTWLQSLMRCEGKSWKGKEKDSTLMRMKNNSFDFSGLLFMFPLSASHKAWQTLDTCWNTQVLGYISNNNKTCTKNPRKFLTHKLLKILLLWSLSRNNIVSQVPTVCLSAGQRQWKCVADDDDDKGKHFNNWNPLWYPLCHQWQSSSPVCRD